mgnify:CR=1 FL=1
MPITVNSGQLAHVTVRRSDKKVITVNKGSGTGGSAIPTYKDSYTVTPRLSTEVVLETKNKKMTDNVTVKKIPVYEVSNEAGGKSLYIPDGIQ